MTIRRPCVEWEQCTKYTETDKYGWEEYLLNSYWYIVKSSNFVDIHCCSSTKIVDTKNTKNQKSTTTHKHKSKLHCSIFLRTCTPNTNKKVHWDKSNFIEHEHCE